MLAKYKCHCCEGRTKAYDKERKHSGRNLHRNRRLFMKRIAHSLNQISHDSNAAMNIPPLLEADLGVQEFPAY